MKIENGKELNQYENRDGDEDGKLEKKLGGR